MLLKKPSKSVSKNIETFKSLCYKRSKRAIWKVPTAISIAGCIYSKTVAKAFWYLKVLLKITSYVEPKTLMHMCTQNKHLPNNILKRYVCSLLKNRDTRSPFRSKKYQTPLWKNTAIKNPRKWYTYSFTWRQSGVYLNHN